MSTDRNISAGSTHYAFVDLDVVVHIDVTRISWIGARAVHDTVTISTHP